MAHAVLERLGGSTRVVRGPANVGLFEAEDGKAVLIDSGNDDDSGRRLLRFCEAEGLKLSLIVNTHSHADHCGGNAFLQSHTACRIAATGPEAAIIETPVLEPSYLWGGYPLLPLRNKFLMAKPSRVTDPLTPPCDVPGTALKALPLGGHSYAMAGVMTPDRVFFAADSIASIDVIKKYHVFFLYDIAAQLETLDALEVLDADWIVPSHAEPSRDMASLIEVNRAKIVEIADFLVGSCAEPMTQEALLAGLALHYGIALNHQQFVLLGATVRSYLAWLGQSRLVSSRLEAGKLLFERI
ncbi:MAG TPA: MBL fold metallo-hydrolase [Rectinemataceae bacterium]|nr:MBL fold metallo-hydrolase [Rectinemataceae bacterium]